MNFNQENQYKLLFTILLDLLKRPDTKIKKQNKLFKFFDFD